MRLNELWYATHDRFRILASMETWEFFYGVFLGAFYFLLGAPTTAMIALGVTMGLDMITKSISIFKNSGGYFKATREKKFRSKLLIMGFAGKIVTYSILLMITHMSYYFFPIVIAKGAENFVYGVLFITESHSCIENLLESEGESKSSNAVRAILSYWKTLFEKIVPQKES